MSSCQAGERIEALPRRCCRSRYSFRLTALICARDCRLIDPDCTLLQWVTALVVYGNRSPSPPGRLQAFVRRSTRARIRRRRRESAPSTSSIDYTNTYSNSTGCGPATPPGQGIPITDPLAGKYSIPAYSASPCKTTSTPPCYNDYKQTTGGPHTLLPGVYVGGIDVGGSISNVTFSPGSYILVVVVSGLVPVWQPLVMA
jgi:hypothetical protein